MRWDLRTENFMKKWHYFSWSCLISIEILEEFYCVFKISTEEVENTKWIPSASFLFQLFQSKSKNSYRDDFSYSFSYLCFILQNVKIKHFSSPVNRTFLFFWYIPPFSFQMWNMRCLKCHIVFVANSCDKMFRTRGCKMVAKFLQSRIYDKYETSKAITK